MDTIKPQHQINISEAEAIATAAAIIFGTVLRRIYSPSSAFLAMAILIPRTAIAMRNMPPIMEIDTAKAVLVLVAVIKAFIIPAPPTDIKMSCSPSMIKNIGVAIASQNTVSIALIIALVIAFIILVHGQTVPTKDCDESVLAAALAA
ncbi:hypothetical protein Barb6_01836 [Bacteroidales bacterium Barb6]|nr:hypothetical protein Barb6_01836 [Bacteroidales bacterium Barb6]